MYFNFCLRQIVYQMVQVYGMNERIGQVRSARMYHDPYDPSIHSLICPDITLTLSTVHVHTSRWHFLVSRDSLDLLTDFTGE